ncbi:MAG TPA: hypothetical protein VGS11_05700 [Candidatus Bathyarchaeia archaeon]|nr:hypothetical protein [Candidatus Bathyarchaeia archaeon]
MKAAILALATLVLILLPVFPVHATTSPPNLSLPSMKDIHLREGDLFTTALNASYVPGIMAWQFHITFNAQAVAVVDYSLGSDWTTSPYFIANRTRNSNGYYRCGYDPSNCTFIVTNHGDFIVGFAYFSDHTLTTAEPTTLLNITWKVLSRFAYTDLHIVSENGNFLTVLLDDRFQIQPYTTTDGSFSNCNHVPSGLATASPSSKLPK